MNFSVLLNLLTQTVYLTLAGSTLLSWARQRNSTRRDIALVFVTLALAIIAQDLQALFPTLAPLLALVFFWAILTQPYLLLRVVRYFRPIPTQLQRAALIGLLVMYVALFLSSIAPLLVVGLFIVYLVGIEGYAVYLLVQGAATIAGVNGRRLRLAAIGSVLFILVFFTAFGLVLVNLVTPVASSWQGMLAPFIQIVAILSGLSYYTSFMPPRWLRHIWQQAELHHFLQATTQDGVHSQIVVLDQLCVAANRTVGGQVAVIARWEVATGQLLLDAIGLPALTAEFLTADLGALGRAWRERRALEARVPHDLTLTLAQWTTQLKVQTVLIIPIATTNQVWGLLLVALPHVPLFAQDDLDVLQLFTYQTANLLDYTALLDKQRALNQILEQHIAERTVELRDSQRQLAGIIGSAMDAIITVNAEQRVVLFNHAAESMFGCLAADVVGQPLDGFIPERFRAIHPEHIRHFGKTDETARRMGALKALTARRMDGSEFPIEASISHIEIGGQAFFSVILRDITERQRVEAQLIYQASLLANVHDSILATDAQQNITAWNRAAEDMYGYTAAEVLGRKAREMVRSELSEAERQQALHSLAENGHYLVEVKQYRRDGQPIWVEGSTIALFDEAKHVTGYVSVSRDITARRQAEAEIIKINAELERRVAERTADLIHANTLLAETARAKDEFLASMSHELRTPLNAILGFAESLREGIYGPLTERQIKSVSTITESSQHLLALINDVLDVAKIEAGKLDLQIVEVEVEAVCQASLRLIMDQAKHKRLHVSLNFDPIVTSLMADPRRLKQMLVNLLSNAVKFTLAEGQIGLEVQADAEQGVVRFIVWDTGIGISPDDAQRLFKPFVQIDSRLSREYGGTGLGLALAYRLAELHQGSVSLTSTPDTGSRFTISLPWAASPKSDLPMIAPPTTALSPILLRRALVIEDSPSAAEQIMRYLNEFGLQVSVYPAGKSAFAHTLEAQPEIILLDIQLPEVSGWEVLEKLKADPRTQAIPVVVVTVTDEAARGLALGAVDYIVKPLTRPRLHEALNKAYAIVAETQPVPAHFPVLLLAEDYPVSQMLYADYLSAIGYRTILASNGLEALERARELRPDLIIMDIQMPKLDGLEAIRQIRDDPNLRSIPIIALTALAMPGDRERCLAAGADDYLSKPIGLTKLAEIIGAHLTVRPV